MSLASNMSEDHQFLMFSATFPAEARKLATHFLAPDHAQIHVGRPGSSHSNIHQVVSERSSQVVLLYDLTLSDCLGRVKHEAAGTLGSTYEPSRMPHHDFLCQSPYM